MKKRKTSIKRERKRKREGERERERKKRRIRGHVGKVGCIVAGINERSN